MLLLLLISLLLLCFPSLFSAVAAVSAFSAVAAVSAVAVAVFLPSLPLLVLLCSLISSLFCRLGLRYNSLTEASSGEMPDKASSAAADLKGTELRLGLPGSGPGESVGLSLGPTPPKGAFASAGAKRGFSDAIDGNEKWCLSGRGGSDVELGKGGALFSVGGEDVAAKPSGRADDLAKDGGAAAKAAPAAKAQVIGWPPIRSYRKNTMAANPSTNKDGIAVKQGMECLFVKVSMDGAPYLRKIDLKTYCNYKELSLALGKMFTCFTIGGQCSPNRIPGREGLTESRMTDLLQGSEYVLTYEDKDGDWMLVGDVPWNMFTDSCRRLRIMKGSDAIGFAPRAMEKSKGWN